MGRDSKRNHAAHPGRTPKPDPTQLQLDADNLRFYASQIVSLEHFELIVAAAKPAMRAYVRRLLAGYVPFAVPDMESTPDPHRGGLRILQVDDETAPIGPLDQRLLRYDDNGE